MKFGEKYESDIERKIINKYESLGYKVISRPKASDYPIDLGNYIPDLIAKKDDSVNLIIEIKNTAYPISIERYKGIAEIISKVDGWKFILVTNNDLEIKNESTQSFDTISDSEIKERLNKSNELKKINVPEMQFVYLWTTLEIVLRKMAINESIPIEKFHTSSLINHLYSLGVISYEQYELINNLNKTRNNVVHGFNIIDIEKDLKSLCNILDDLISVV